MTNGQFEPGDDRIVFADLGKGVYVIAISGRANYAITPDLRSLTQKLSAESLTSPDKYSFIFDMENVETMDSTFMGAMAGIALRQKKDTSTKIVLCNLNPHCQQLLSTLGVSHFVELRVADPSTAQMKWQTADKETLSKVEMTTMMLEAHETLSNLVSSNEVQFAGVIDYLKKCLQDQSGKKI